jgi:hypothetical protein
MVGRVGFFEAKILWGPAARIDAVYTLYRIGILCFFILCTVKKG